MKRKSSSGLAGANGALFLMRKAPRFWWVYEDMAILNTSRLPGMDSAIRTTVEEVFQGFLDNQQPNRSMLYIV
jgi:hypothetical protein